MTPWVLRLVIANTAMFVLVALMPGLSYLLAFVPAAVLVRPWTIVTYMFMHAGLMHLLLNMLGLFFFGPRLEARLGSGHFLALYFVSGMLGAVLTFVLAPFAPVVGASGAVMGVLAAYARFWPHDRILIWGILPVSAWLMVIATALYSIWAGLTGSGGNVAHFAHLGGLVAGWLYVVVLDRRRKNAWPSARKAVREIADPSRDRVERWTRIRPEELHEINRTEVERLLAKVKEAGPRSLTAAEAEFLDRFAPRAP